ncbi:MAG TPA: (Fe-S)-binding protein, partial [Bacteroidetes bacterium]|nr:(Fe-S)-binding protein [Bacteroidota bacterium]
TEEPYPHRKLPYHVENPPRGRRVDLFLEAFAAVLQHTDYKPLLDSYLSTSNKCNRCSVTCPVYQVTGDPRDVPCYKTTLLLEVYRRYFTIAGWFRSRFGSGFELTEEMIDEMAELFYRCTACRKCTLECPMGMDHGLMTRLGRYILSLIGLSPKALQVSVREQLEGETHNTSKVPTPALLSNLEFLEEELEESLGVKLKIPVDRTDRDFVFFCAVSDYLMEPDTLMGNAAVLYAAGDWDRWTIGTGNYDGINYGLFYSDWHLERIIKRLVGEVTRLRGKNILIGECGHASRSAHDFVPVFGGREAYPVISFIEYTLDCLRKGKIRLNPDVITEKVTYHDPCNIARSGWIVEQPREILKSFVPNYIEMTPNGRENYCCGGGGGLVSIDEIHEFRMRVSGRTKAEQIRDTGAEIVVAPCANCKKQLRELVDYYELGCEVMGLHDLILKAIEIPGGKSPAERREAAEMFAM